jgi:hypothetical protein
MRDAVGSDHQMVHGLPDVRPVGRSDQFIEDIACWICIQFVRMKKALQGDESLRYRVFVALVAEYLGKFELPSQVRAQLSSSSCGFAWDCLRKYHGLKPESPSSLFDRAWVKAIDTRFHGRAPVHPFARLRASSTPEMDSADFDKALEQLVVDIGITRSDPLLILLQRLERR